MVIKEEHSNICVPRPGETSTVYETLSANTSQSEWKKPMKSFPYVTEAYRLCEQTLHTADPNLHRLPHKHKIHLLHPSITSTTAREVWRGQMQGVSFVCFSVICNLLFLPPADALPTVTLGVILDFDSPVGKVATTAITLAAHDVNADTKLLHGTRLILDLHNSPAQDPILGASTALDLLKREVVAIIGQQTSEVTEFVARLGDAVTVPIVSFAATNPLLSMHRYPYFIRMAHSDALQMKAIAAVVRAYGWRRVVVVHVADDFGTGPLSFLNDALREVDIEIESTSAIPPNADAGTIKQELYKLMAMQSRVFIAHVHSQLGSNLFIEAHKLGMMDAGYVWIVTDVFTTLLGTFNASTLASMQGVLGVKSFVKNSNKLDAFTARWERKFRLDNPKEEKAELNRYGLFAYDSVWLIAQAIDNLLRLQRNITSFNFTDYVASNPRYSVELTDNLKVFQNGPQLLKELLHTNFAGLSGPVQFHDGEIAGSTFQIVNVIGKSYSVVGYWKDGRGLSRNYSSKGYNSLSANTNGLNNIGTGSIAADLNPVIWPGRFKKVRRGWVPAAEGKKIKIGVPLKDGFNQFVKVTYDRRHEPNATGFCIDVFEAVTKKLHYKLEYEFVPYRDKHDNVTHNYDKLVDQVYLKRFDAVVGDTTILAERLNHVDFTQPFTESGLVMVVPITVKESNGAWAFMKPFTPGMWGTTGAFFVFTGAVVWLLEHKLNPHFRGTPKYQVVTLLWFSFSTPFFSQKERVVSSLGRMVVIVWLFVVLILTSSYTASFTSILTRQQMQPSIQDVDSLRASGAAVGYQEGSFVRDYLHTQLGISKRKLKPYSTPEEYAEALSKGAKNGGVAAIFDEIPSIRVFLSTNCGYTIAGPTYRTGGFGFVFPKGSPLVSDISKGVLALSEHSKDMQRIESKWFNKRACNNPGGGEAFNRLSMKSFWGVYLITGIAFMIALIIFSIQLCYDFSRDPNAAQEILTMSQSNTISVSTPMKSFAEFADRKSPPPANSTWNGGGINAPISINVSPSSFNITTPSSFDDHGDSEDTQEIESAVEGSVSARSSSASLFDQESDV